MVIEARPGVPEEAVAEKPKSVLKQIRDVLEARRDKDGNPFIVIRGIRHTIESLFQQNTTIVICPVKTMFDIHDLVSFAVSIKVELEDRIKPPPSATVIGAKRLDEKGGFTFPQIDCGDEAIGEQITRTTHTKVDDDQPINEESDKRFIKRHTSIIICPSLQVADLCWTYLNGDMSHLPKPFQERNKTSFEGLKRTIDISYGITEKQLQLFRRTTPSMPNFRF